MAKLALVRYGSEGEGPSNDPKKAYTYVVNDNVRKGDRISPVVKHHGANGTIFATTGVVQATAKNASTEKGKEMQKGLDGKEATEVYTGKELGIGAQRGTGGKFATSEEARRGGNISAYMMTHGESDKLSAAAQKSVETFKSYSEAFIPKGKR